MRMLTHGVRVREPLSDQWGRLGMPIFLAGRQILEKRQGHHALLHSIGRLQVTRRYPSDPPAATLRLQSDGENTPVPLHVFPPEAA